MIINLLLTLCPIFRRTRVCFLDFYIHAFFFVA